MNIPKNLRLPLLVGVIVALMGAGALLLSSQEQKIVSGTEPKQKIETTEDNTKVVENIQKTGDTQVQPKTQRIDTFTPSPTSGSWTDAENKISLILPKTWEVIPDQRAILAVDSAFSEVRFYVIRVPVTPDQTLEVLKQANEKEGYEFVPYVLSTEKAIQTSADMEDGTRTDIIFAIHNSELYQLVFNTYIDGDNMDQALEEYDLVLSSFRFLK